MESPATTTSPQTDPPPPPPPPAEAAQAPGEPPPAVNPPQETKPPPQPQLKRDPVPFTPTNVDEMYRYARMLAGASLLPRSFYDRDDKERRNPKIADVHYVLLKGQALGLHPTVSISTINIIDGKAEIGAQLMVALCLKSGLCEYFDLVHSDERSATFATNRRGGRREISFTYAIEEADQMGLLDKGKSEWAKENNQWKKQPRTMLRRRCQAMLAREVFPDVVMGLYDHDELAEMREREVALGVDPDRVIQVDGAAVREPSDGVPALPAGSERVSLGAMADAEAAKRAAAESRTVPVRRDPLKERLAARQVATTTADGAPVLGPGEVLCKSCQVPIEGKPGDLCGACRDS